MLNELSIICFLSVAEHQSFTKAAEEVSLSRQAVSKKILALEKRLGVRLFDRTTSVIELTIEGQLYLHFFRNMLHDFEAFTEAVGKTDTPTVFLPIGYELGIIIDKNVIENIEEFKRQRSNIGFKIRRYEPQVIENKLLSGQLDMAFTTIPVRNKISKDFSYIPLEVSKYVLVTSKNHPKVNEDTSLADFNGEQVVYWNMDNGDDLICRKNFNAAWADIGITVIPSIQCTSLSSAYAELLLGNAVMLCNAKNELCLLPEIITYPLPKKGIFGCVWSNNAPSAIKEFAEAFKKYELSRSEDGLS